MTVENFKKYHVTMTYVGYPEIASVKGRSGCVCVCGGGGGLEFSNQ